MASVIGWLDYSEEHRQKMREIIDLFKDEDSVDELGIGSIRDTFSDLLFPGLSTVQTRARYFLLIPWVYRRLEDERVPSAKAASRARHLQTELIVAMERGGATGGEGIIGWEARQRVQRLPSNVYWTGLKAFGIRLFSGSIEDYHRSLDSYQEKIRHYNRGEGDELAERLHPNWTSHLPPAPGDLWKETTIELSKVEARFLKNQISLYCGESLLAFLLEHPTDLLEDASTPWDHPAASETTDELRSWLNHGRLFSEVMHGAALAYNLMLAERASQAGLSIGEDDLEDRYQTEIQDWVTEMEAHAHGLQNWDISQLWQIVTTANQRIPYTARAFADRWIMETRRDAYRVAGLPQDIRSLISDRERRLKKGKARLHHHRALEMWSGRSGLARLTYRWGTAQTMIADIHRGLGHA